MENYFSCVECGKLFRERRYLREHMDSVHSGFRYRCPQCCKVYSQTKGLCKHFQSVHADSKCLYCDQAFVNSKALLGKKHMDNCLHIRPSIDQFPNALDKQDQMDIENSVKEVSVELNSADYTPEILNVVRNFWRLIRTQKSLGNLLDHTYNFHWASIEGNFYQMMSSIYTTEKQAFKINAAIGCILKNRETDDVKYWYSCQNNFSLLDNPEIVKDASDVQKISNKLAQIDLTDKFSRPNTKWYLAAVTNVEFYVTPLVNFVAGCTDYNLPKQIAHQRHNILGMTQDRQHNKFTDNLCLFRCISQCLTNNFENEAFVYQSFITYCNAKRIEAIIDQFQGVPLSDIDIIEALFDIDIQIFYTNESGHTTCWKNALKKRKWFINLDISLNNNGRVHFSYIVNLDQYAKRYGCLDCGRVFKKAELLNYHTGHHCNSGRTRHKFTGGIFRTKRSIFEQLECLDIFIPQADRYCPFIAVFDFESLLIKNMEQPSEKLVFTTTHVPLSCAISTNVPGFEPQCFIRNDPDVLMQKVLNALKEISIAHKEILSTKFQSIFEKLDDLETSSKDFVVNLKRVGKDFRREKGQLNYIQKVKKTLSKYCEQLTCIGFNSGKYDINLIKRNIFPELVKEARENVAVQWPQAILRNGSYLCLSTDALKFLDASVYAAPGFSLDSFMRAYKATLVKACFPYEYMDNFDKLHETALPPKECFYSSLKKAHISDADYAQCIQYWKDQQMQTMSDYLKFYNLRDVIPFLESCVNMSSIYWANFKIDIFREAMSLAGVTERYLFNNIPDTYFVLFSEKAKNLYYSLRDSMRGGLAMVMTRLAVKDQTCIRNNPDYIVKSIIGLDFNALYLWAQSMPTPVGHFDHWIPTNHNTFLKDLSSRTISIEWLEFESQQAGFYIQHLGNNIEKKVGDRCLPVDGYCQVTNTVYEFYGCYWHCHKCALGLRNKTKDPVEADTWIEEKEAYIKSLRYNIITIWECEWLSKRRSYIQQNPTKFRQFYDKKFVSCHQMTTAILDASVFGFAKVDIVTPEELKATYADFPPIIKHAEVGIEDIGEHMKEYAQQKNQLKQPRKCLISSYFGKEIMLSTPMIQFLVGHGLLLQKIYEVIQFDKSQPFEHFCAKVTQHRREGDDDPSLSMLADTYKLLGNTGYGKTLTNKESHCNVFYCDSRKAIECSYSPYLKKLKSIGTDCYEVHMRKSEIVLDLPIVVGLSVYNWAKIRMLEFFYDILQVYFDSKMYQCMETDTDSIYLALSCNDLLDAVKAELKDKFLTEIYPKWFVTKKDDKRTPGLLKVEWQGTSMCCLTAKTYMGIGDREKPKISCKGLMKRTNELVFDKYTAVLTTKTPCQGQNIGFRMRQDNNMWSYIQEKQGLPYLYIKRKVLEDGITTEPLDL